MYKSTVAKRRNIRVKFNHRVPKVFYRPIADSKTTEVSLVDLSETGFSFVIDSNDEITEVGHILYVDFKDLNGGKSTDFTARIVRFQSVEGKLVFAAEFISVTNAFKKNVAKLAKIYINTGFFLVERRTPISITLRASKKYIEWLSLLYEGAKWQLAIYNEDFLPITQKKNSISSRNLTHCVDFDQI